MNWMKIFFFGIIGWGFPFLLVDIVFTSIPQSFAFVLYLLAAAILIIAYSESSSSGYLRRRFRLSAGSGMIIGIVWLIIAYIGSAAYNVLVLDEKLITYTVFDAPLFLLYPIVTTIYGYSESNRSRRR